MNEIKVFENEQFGEIRTVTIDGQPWFVGKDVANALGYNKSRNAIAQHVDDEDKTPALIQGGCSTGTQKTMLWNSENCKDFAGTQTPDCFGKYQVDLS